MKKNIFTSQGFLFCFLLVCGILFFIQDYFFISDWDDIFYKFVCTDQSMGYVPQLFDGKHRFVQKLSDIFYSQYNHYFGSNGRFIVHCIVQYATSFLNCHQFAFLNSIVFILLLWGMHRLADYDLKIQNAVLIVLFLVVLCPLTVAAFLCNISWSVNYLWTAAATVWWLVLYEKICVEPKTFPIYRLVAISIISIIVGSLQEAFSIGLCAALGIYHIITIKKLSWNKAIVICSYAIGTLIILASPANYRKAEGRIGGIQIDAVLDVLSTYVMIVFVVAVLLSFIMNRKMTLDFIKKHAVLFITIIFTLGFCIFVVYNGSRQFTIATIFCIILLVRLINLYNCKFVKYSKYCFIVVGGVLLVCFYPTMYSLRKNLGEAYENIIEKAVNESSTIVNSQSYEDMRDRISNSLFSDYFVINPLNGNPESHYLSILVSKGKDMNFIQAVIPVSLPKLKDIYIKKHDKTGVVHLCDHIHVCALTKEYKPEKVSWIYKTTFRNPNTFHDVSSSAIYVIGYEGLYYYIFNTAPNKIISKKIIVQ